jgi:tetrahydromethanopterin S-methyltransferase subunit F
MAIGNQTTYSMASLNAELADVAKTVEDAHLKAQEFFGRINALGVSGLTTIGFVGTDAQAFFDTANYLNTDARVYFGIATVASPFNFSDATAKAR